MNSYFYHIWYWIVAVFCIFTHFVVALFSFVTFRFRKTHRKLAREFIKIIAKAMKLKVHVQGLENIPKNRACVFMANHSSLIDILVMVIAVPQHFNFIAKKELFWVPFIGLDMLFGGDFFIDRKNPRKAKRCLNRVEDHLKNGWNMLIFPEGTRSSNGELLPFKRGAFNLAAASGACIIPCYINGSDQIVKKKSLTATPGDVHIYFAPPVYPKSNDTSKASTKSLIDITYNEIHDLKEKHYA